MKNTRTYRSEAPVKIYKFGKNRQVNIQAGRGQNAIGEGNSAKSAYYAAISNYRRMLRANWIVPAIIDENGAAL